MVRESAFAARIIPKKWRRGNWQIARGRFCELAVGLYFILDFSDPVLEGIGIGVPIGGGTNGFEEHIRFICVHIRTSSIIIFLS